MIIENLYVIRKSPFQSLIRRRVRRRNGSLRLLFLISCIALLLATTTGCATLKEMVAQTPPEPTQPTRVPLDVEVCISDTKSQGFQCSRRDRASARLLPFEDSDRMVCLSGEAFKELLETCL